MSELKLFIGVLFTMILLSGAAHAQQPLSAVGDAPSAEKVALIKQILELTSSKKTIDAMLKARTDEMERQLPEITWQSVAEMNELKSLTAAQREQLHNQVIASMHDLSERIYDRIKQRIDFNKVIEDISIPLYNKYFTEAELKDLLTFYQSPTGKKVVEVLPELTTEAMNQTAQVLAPQLLELVSQIEREESERMKKQVLQETSTPKPKTTPTKRPASRRKTH